jgi:Spy/CpxP family protein refolding chaperone
MRDQSPSGRFRRIGPLVSGVLLLGFGASAVFSQAPAPAKPAPAERDPNRDLLLLKKAALQAEIRAAEARVGLSQHLAAVARSRNRAHLESDDYVFNTEVDILENQAVVARKQAELAEMTSRIQAYHRGTPEEGSNVDITDDLLRRIKDLEARVEIIEGKR